MLEFFSVRMALIFPDFQKCKLLSPLPVGKSGNIIAILRYTGKIPM